MNADLSENIPSGIYGGIKINSLQLTQIKQTDTTSIK